MSLPNWKNRTIWTGDNLPIMRGLNSESVDLIYLDPPFNSNQDYAAPIGSKAAGAAFKDTWTLDDVDRLWLLMLGDKDPLLFHVIEAGRLVHGKGMASYLSMMAQRLGEMKRILKPTGSIYLHCDPTASHYLKLLMDAVFTPARFRNEIIWCYRGGGVPRKDFARKHDTILRYAQEARVFNVDDVRIPYSPSVTESGVSRYDKSYRANKTYEGYRPNKKGKHPEDWWTIQPLMPSDRKERLGYPTQKPLALVERIVKASSNPGGVVLDPFAGCATACVAAERHGRQWLGIDISEKAAELVQVRIRKEIDLFHDFKPIHRTDQPQRTDLGKLSPPSAHKDVLYGKQSGQCGGCMVMFHKRNLTLDHIVPRAYGGTDHIENLWLLCGACNSSKGTKSQAEFLKERVKRGEPIEWFIN